MPLAAALAAPRTARAQQLEDHRLALIDDPVRVELKAGVTLEQLRAAIGRAAAAHDWQVTERPDGFQLVRTIRSQHQMTVQLNSQPDGYTIRYLSSVNLLYRDHDRTGRPLRAIHRNYNVWVRELATAINAALGVGGNTFVETGRGGAGKAPDTQAAPIPDRLAIVPAADDTPAAVKLFAGAWQGKWGGELDHILIVERIEGRTIHYVYSFGTSRTIRKAGFRRGAGTVDEAGVLRIVTGNGTLISYEPSKDGQSLQGQFQQGAKVSSGVFTRRPLNN